MINEHLYNFRNTGKRIVKNTNVEKVKFKPPYNNQHTAL